MNKLPKTYTGPGLVDIQINGYAGFNFNGDGSAWIAENLHVLGEKLARRGVAVILPTLTTDDSQRMIALARRYAGLVEADEQLARLMPKLHIEGPFISPVEGPRGAHPKCHIKPPTAMPDFFERVMDASGGRIGMMTLAPELPGAIDLIGRLAEAGVVPAIGHCQASGEIIAEAVAAGAKISTHLGNGSHRTLPRLDNYVQTQLAEDRLFASFIADDQHMPLGTLKNFIRAKTPTRSVLVTDAIAAAEMPPGIYNFGHMPIEVSAEGRCSHPGQWNLAGSVLTMDRAVINTFLHCDVTFEEAWAMASTQPARLLGVPVPGDVTVRISETEFVRQ